MYLDNKFGDSSTIQMNFNVTREVYEKLSQYAVWVSPIEIAQKDISYQISIPFVRYDRDGNLARLTVPDEFADLANTAIAMLEDFKLHNDLDLSKLRYRIGTSDLRLWKEGELSDLRWYRYLTGEESYNFAKLSAEERLRVHNNSLRQLSEIAGKPCPSRAGM